VRPDTKEKKDKSIIAYVREMDKLRKVCRDAPLVPLEKPYQNGWTKYFELRDDYTRRDDAQIFRNVLKVIGEEVFCRKQNFIGRNGKEYGPGLRVVGKNEWEMLGWTPQYKKHFEFGRFRRSTYFGMNWNDMIEGYKMIKPYFLIEAIKPHFITHTKTIYPDVEARIAFIQKKFTKQQLWRRYDHLKGHKRYSRDWVMAKSIYMEALGTKEIEKWDQSE
jgi:hypothetical protein